MGPVPETQNMIALYSVALALALILGLPYWLAVMLFSGKYREGLSERLGFVPRRLRPSSSGEKAVWLHAVSVGELLAAEPLIAALRARSLRVFVSTTTRTAQQIARQRFGADSVFYFPLDFTFLHRRYLRRLEPSLLVLMESEFWPNFLRAAPGIPLGVVNARISDRSFPRYRKLRFFWKEVLAPVTRFLAQSPTDAQRLIAIGAPAARIEVIGNLKYDLAPVGELHLLATLRDHLPSGARVFVCGSTMEGEEAALLSAHHAALLSVPNLVTIMAPRHPERFDVVARMLPANSIRRSSWGLAPTPIPPGSIFLLDSIGELAAIYSLATVAFVGGSLLPPGGGHNPLEPARFGVPTLAGPHTQNFRDITSALELASALTVVTPASLSAELSSLLTQPELTAERGRRALAVVQTNQGATQRTLDALLQSLSASPERPA
jgi:3-deoxy-D-manno-octulosonic-acid transferase